MVFGGYMDGLGGVSHPHSQDLLNKFAYFHRKAKEEGGRAVENASPA
jgi:hypothetical protein